MPKATATAPFSRNPMWHLPPKPEKGSSPENPTVAYCQSLLESARNFRDQHLGMSDRWKAYRSWYLAAGDAFGKRSNTSANMIFEKVESVSSDLSEADPTILYSPRGPQDLPLSDFLNHVSPFIWDQEEGTPKYHSALKASCLYGTSYWKIVHDPGYPNTGPRVRILEIPPWNLFPAPYACSFEDSPYIIEVRPRTVGEIFAEYGVRVNPEIVNRDTDMAEDLRTYPQVVAAENTEGNVVPSIYSDMLSSYMDSGVCFQCELWIKDGTRVKEFFFEDQLDSPIPKLNYGPTLRYPEGRVISWAGDKLLYDRPSPYRDGEFPYVRYRDVPMPDFWYGMGEVEPLINLQVSYDDTHEVIKLFHLFSVFGKLIIDTGTGLEEGMLENAANQILWVNPGTADRVKWLQGMQPPPELYNYMSKMEFLADRISGRHDVSRGEQPGSVTAAKAIITLQQAANIRVRQRMKEIERAIKRAGLLIGSRIQQFWPSELSMRVGAPPMQKDAMAFRQFVLNPADRQAKFNVKVAATANLAQLKAAEFQRVLLLKQMGLVDDEELIRAADLTNEEEILQKLDAVKMQSMIQAAMMGQQGGGPQNGNDQTRAGNESDQQARRQRANNRAVAPAQG